MERNVINDRRTPDDKLESAFRQAVRDALDLDLFTRDDQIVDEITSIEKGH